MNRPEKISKLAYYLMDKEPLFYLFIINTDFVLDEVCSGSDYAAVGYQDNRVKFHYTTKFAELPIKQMYFVIIHEAYHIFKRHLSIHQDIQKKNFMLANIAEDAIINTEILKSKFNGIAPDVTGLSPFLIPDEYSYTYSKLGDDANVSPRLFNWYLEKGKKEKSELFKQGGFCKNDKTGEYGRISWEFEEGMFYVDVYKDIQDLLDNKDNRNAPTKSTKASVNDLTPVFINSKDNSFNQATYEGESEAYGFSDTHEQLNEEPKEVGTISQQVFTQKIIKQAREMTDNNPQLKKGAGKDSGNSVLDRIEKLMKPEISWKKIFKKNVNLYYSDNSINKTKKKSVLTYLMNAKSRYGFIFPHWIKVKDKLQKYIFIAMDVSGSCFSDSYDLEKFFSEIDNMAEELEFTNSGKVFVLQWDWGVTRSFVEYKKGDWKHFKLQGGGGTNPVCIFNHISTMLKPIGNSYYGVINETPLFIPDKKKMPFLIVLTDGYFYDNLRTRDLGLYEGNEKNILFVTKSTKRLYEDAKFIQFK